MATEPSSARGGRIAERLARPFLRFLELEASSALVLLGAALVALAWANSPWGAGYERLWETPLGVRAGEAFDVTLSLRGWINEALMAVFFLVVGMEIKRELVHGELSSPTRAALPAMGALGGMVVPAGLYLALQPGGGAERGWGIPMATDIAFAVAALSLLGSRVPSGLRVFLLALAIVDDLGAVAVIALFYTEDLELASLGLAAAGLVAGLVLRWAGVRALGVYALLGIWIWYETHHSGIHATVAGVAMGLLAPTQPERADAETLVERGRRALEHLREILTGQEAADPAGHHRHQLYRQLQSVGREALSPLDYLVNGLERWVAFVVMPLFALANAGVVLDATTLGDPRSLPVALAVGVGLVAGKPLGIALFSWLAVRAGVAELPRGVGMGAVLGAGTLAGIGFTVALFITALAFEDPVIVAGAKLGILVGSAVATALGLAVLHRLLPAAGGSGSS
jgi:NhaA family Na+:H+ antiporter